MMPLAALMVSVAIPMQSKLHVVTENLAFPEAGKTAVHTFADQTPGFAFTEVIPSWNVESPERGVVSVELRAKGDGYESKWYSMGSWSLARGQQKGSKEKQKDGHADVLTDTFRLNRPATSLDVRVTLQSLSGSAPKLKLLTLSFWGGDEPIRSANNPAPAWGKLIEVPRRAQGNYPRGGVLCSPTSLSMVLWHYANVLRRPELNKDVPELERAVWDEVYRGAGNWSFNVAYAGSLPGLRSYVTRLASVEEAERFIEAGIPLICSAPLNLLRGQQERGNSGHLVVLIGFTKSGDPIFNDPAKTTEVRRIYKRADFERAWATSKNTVYLIHPEEWQVPTSAAAISQQR